MAIDPATSKALSHRLAVEQSAQRLPSVAAGLVRDGELVWSEAVGTLDGRADGAGGRPAHPVPDRLDHQDLRRG